MHIRRKRSGSTSRRSNCRWRRRQTRLRSRHWLSRATSGPRQCCLTAACLRRGELPGARSEIDSRETRDVRSHTPYHTLDVGRVVHWAFERSQAPRRRRRSVVHRGSRCSEGLRKSRSSPDSGQSWKRSVEFLDAFPGFAAKTKGPRVSFVGTRPHTLRMLAGGKLATETGKSTVPI